MAGCLIACQSLRRTTHWYGTSSRPSNTSKGWISYDQVWTDIQNNPYSDTPSKITPPTYFKRKSSSNAWEVLTMSERKCHQHFSDILLVPVVHRLTLLSTHLIETPIHLMLFLTCSWQTKCVHSHTLVSGHGPCLDEYLKQSSPMAFKNTLRYSERRNFLWVPDWP